VCESVLLFVVTKRRLGLHIFIIGRQQPPPINAGSAP
jgi:hypothetical protein